MAEMKLPQDFISTTDEKTFQYDDDLPSLPIPPLNGTLAKYLDSVKPHLTEFQYKQTKFIVEQFENGVGKELNHKLHERAKYKKNWLAKWWDDVAYLMVRSPSPAFNNFAGPGPYVLDIWPAKEGTQEFRAALNTWFILKYWQILRRQQYKIDRAHGGKVLWTMNQFRRKFNSCRIPGVEKDSMYWGFKTEDEGDSPTHIMVVCRGRIFTFEAIDENLEPLTVPELEVQLRRITEQCYREPAGPGIGSLTSENRTTWAKLRQHLLELHPDNGKALEMIQTSLMCLVLDEGRPDTYTALNREGLLGDCNSRWFDKSMTSIVFKNGTLSCNCDHAPYEAMCLVSCTYFAYAGIHLNKGEWKGTTHVRSQLAPSELKFHLDSTIEQGISQARIHFKVLDDSIDNYCPIFKGFGKKFIRKYKLHPDTFVQVALQLAYYRTHNKPGSCYETASTRKFWWGRTETVRVCTPEVVAWAKAMLDGRTSEQRRLQMMVAAIDKHNKLMAEAEEGMGCDRHLLGLQLTAMEENIPTPLLFLDKAYKLSGGGGNFTLSTSFIGYTPVFGGLAPMCENGYGAFYCIEPDRISLFMACFIKNEETDIHKLYGALSQSLEDMQKLLETSTGTVARL